MSYSWENVKKQRTPLTWGTLALVIGLLWSTEILHLIWFDGVNARLMSEAEASLSHQDIAATSLKQVKDLRFEFDQYHLSMAKQLNTAEIAKARKEIGEIEGQLRFRKDLSEEEKEFKRERKKELNELIKCIKSGKDNCVE